MDLQKEREAFEKECRLLCYKGNMVMSNLGSFYNNEQTNWMWQMWLSAKAQAVPEGFVVVPKEPTQEMVEVGMGNFNFPLDNGRFSNHDLIFAYRAMIEAQEQSHDLFN